jgi:hypothetical protein
MNIASPSHRVAGVVLRAIIGVGLVLAALKIVSDPELRERLGPTYTFMCYLVIALSCIWAITTSLRLLAGKNGETGGNEKDHA